MNRPTTRARSNGGMRLDAFEAQSSHDMSEGHTDNVVDCQMEHTHPTSGEIIPTFVGSGLTGN